MFTTASKLFFGIAAFAVGASLLFLWTADEGVLFGFFVPISLAAVALFLGTLLIAYRDVEVPVAVVASSASDAEGSAPVGAGVATSIWPLVAGVAGGVIGVGLVTDNRFFVGGLALLGAAVVEWMVADWADRASGDPVYNRSLRDRFMHPIEFPLAGLLVAGLVIFGFSRIMLAVPRNASFVLFAGIAVTVLIVGVGLSLRPDLGRRVVTAVLAVGAAGLLAGAVAGILHGERSFEEGRVPQAPKFVSDSANTAASVAIGNGGFDVPKLQLPKGLAANVLIRNNASVPAIVVVDGRYSDSAGNSHGQLFLTHPLKPGGTALITVRLTRSGDYPFIAQDTHGKTIASGSVTVP